MKHFGPYLFGLALGLSIFMFRSEPTLSSHELKEWQAYQHQLEERLSSTLTHLNSIDEAKIHLAIPLPNTKKKRVTASLILKLSNPPLSDEEVSNIALQVASSVNDLHPGDIRIMDTSGNQLNKDATDQRERGHFWTIIAINVAKVLGILAALITLRFIIQAVGKGSLVDKNNPSKETKSTQTNLSV